MDVPVFEMGQADPVEIARKAVAYAKDYGRDIVILDTAGRLHIDEELMAELQRIKAEVKTGRDIAGTGRYDRPGCGQCGQVF